MQRLDDGDRGLTRVRLGNDFETIQSINDGAGRFAEWRLIVDDQDRDIAIPDLGVACFTACALTANPGANPTRIRPRYARRRGTAARL